MELGFSGFGWKAKREHESRWGGGGRTQRRLKDEIIAIVFCWENVILKW